MEAAEMFAALAAEFPRDAVHWRAQTLTGDGSKALALAYLDARDVMDRLDAVCTPGGWRNSVVETAKGRVVATIEIKIDGEWIGKTDGAGNTDVEGEKGGISDALKRAAVLWGIGRYLYRLDAVWAPCDTYERGGKKVWKAWKGSPWQQVRDNRPPATTQQPAQQKSAETDKPTGPINDTTRQWLATQIDQRRLAVGDLCRAFKVTSLVALTYEQIDDVKAWMANQRKAA